MTNFYLNILDKLGVGIILIDDKQNIIHWNKWIERVSGLAYDDVYNRPIGEVCPKFCKDVYNNVLKTVGEGGEGRFLSGAIHGGFFVKNSSDAEAAPIRQNLQIEPISFEDQKFVLIQIVDVTGQYQRVNNMRNFIKELETENDEIRQTEEKARKLAMHDVLTGLPNRLLYMNQLSWALGNASRNKEMFAVAYLDLDSFKQVNDTYGHNAGDILLKQVANRLKQSLRSSDLVARLGGDEFTFILKCIKSKDDVSVAAKKIIAAFDAPFLINDVLINISPSIGISMYPVDGLEAQMLLEKADSALYAVKSSGKNSFAFYYSQN